MLANLQQYYMQAFPEEARPMISNLVQINDGWESDVYAFQVESGPPEERSLKELILRIYPGQDAYEKSANEYRSLTVLKQAGYPVPSVFRLERDHSPFERPFLIMEKIPGRSMWPLIYRNPDPDEARRHLVQFCALFLRLHRLDWRPYVPDPSIYEPDTPTALIDRQLARARPLIAQANMPGFTRVFQWLENNRDSAAGQQSSLVHWDFHPNNILVREPSALQQEPAVVIDWTGLEISDYRFDLAWTLLIILSYEGQAARLAVLQTYEQLAGAPVQALAFYDAVASFRRLFSIVFSVKYGAESLGMRPGAENIMRDQRGPIQRVYQLLQTSCGFDVPEVEELLKP